MATLRSALLEGLSEGDMRELAQALLAKAKSGDVGACKLLLSYSVGEPLPPADPDRLEEHEFSVARGRPGDLERTILAAEGKGY